MAYGQDDSPTGLPQATEGNYQMDQQSGLFRPTGRQTKTGNPYSQLSQLINAYEKASLRKQAGSPLNMTSTAPPDFLQSMRPANTYLNYGVDYSGNYGKPQGSDPYSAMFSPIPGGY